MNENFDIGALEYVNTSAQLSEEETDKLDGTRAKIATTKTVQKKIGFDINGNALPAGQTRDAWYVRLETVPVATNKMGQPVTVTEDFPLKQHKVTGRWVASLHEKSKTSKLFKKYNVNKFEEMIGRDVVLSKKVRTNGTTYLGLSLG